jgi:hypothetical protein
MGGTHDDMEVASPVFELQKRLVLFTRPDISPLDALRTSQLYLTHPRSFGQWLMWHATISGPDVE